MGSLEVVLPLTRRPVASALIVVAGCAALACGSRMALGQPHASAKSTRRSPASAAVATSTDSSAAAIGAPGMGSLASIEDPSGQALAVFHAALRRAESGAGQARIVFYGASHVASDLFTGPVRQRLQQRFGEAGPGFVLLGRPWRWYRHAGIEIEQNRGFKPYRVKARAPEDGIYGLAGVAVDAAIGKPAVAAIGTRGGHDLSGHVSRVELYYLKQRRGGRLTLLVDGRVKQRIQTAADRPETAYAALELEDAPHQIELRTAGDGPVRVFGISLERDVPGVILDTLGVPGARARDHLHWDDAVYREHLARRRPDLLVLAYGTNEVGDDDVPIELYESRLRRVLERAREVAAQASCLLIGPSDRPLRNDDGSFSDRPLTAAVIAVQRRVAGEFGCGFFDLRRFMGGPMSMLSWVAAQPPLATLDHVHFTNLGYERLAESLHASLLSGLPPTDAAPAGAIAASPAATSPAAHDEPDAAPVPHAAPAGAAQDLPGADK